MKTKRISNGTSGKIGICIIRWVVFALIAFVVLMPVYWIFISSITPPGELFKSPIEYLPKHPSLESYQFLVSHVGLLEKIRNTIIISGNLHLHPRSLRVLSVQGQEGRQSGVSVHCCNDADSGGGHGKAAV